MEDMFQETMMQKRTITIIDLAQVKKGENVLILCDYHTANLGKLLTAQVFQRNAVPIFTVIPPLKAHADPVPEPVYKMAMEADVIIAPMTVSIGHTPLRHEALKKGKNRLGPPILLWPESLPESGDLSDEASQVLEKLLVALIQVSIGDGLVAEEALVGPLSR